jgi:propionyl-CoA synthetase
MGFVVLKKGSTRAASDIEADAIKLVRDVIGPVAAFKTVLVVERLPKTRSGKTLRGTLRQVAEGGEYKVPATIDDPAILTDIAALIAARNGAAKAG